MSTVSAGDQTLYANAKQVWAKPILNIEPLDEIADALVNQASISYPITSLTVDNTSADWLDGVENMLFRIEQPDGTVITWGVLNYDNAANTFYPDVKSDGDFGYAANLAITISDDDVIRVYRNRPIWGMLSRVTEAGIQNKRWNKTYTNEGTTPPPVCIMGHDQRQDIDTGTALATFSFDASDSYDWISSASITTFLYTLPTGASVTGGSVNTDSVTFTIAAGIYTVQCLITSSSGISRSGFRTIYANDTSSNKSFGESHPIQSIASDSTDINGWEGQFTVLGDISSDIYPGAKCHLNVLVYYDGVRLTDNDAFIDVFIGYLSEINIKTDSNRVKTSTLTFKSPLKLANMLPSATQTFEEVATATTWTQVINGLSNPAYAAYYILQYHTTMIDNHDFLYESSIIDLRRRVFGFPADNIAAQLALVGQIMRGDVGCRSDGTITLTQEPSLLDNTARNALDSKFTWTEESVQDRLVVAPTFRPKVAYFILAAVAYAGNPQAPVMAAASKAPGNAQAQGVTKTNMPSISVTLAGGIAELYAAVGHMFAFLNNPLAKLDIKVRKMFDIADPADPDWHVLNISETNYLPITMDLFGARWSSTMRMRPVRVNRQWSRQNGSWLKAITQQNRVESFGQPGVFHPTYTGQIQPYINPLSGWLDGLNITMPDINIDFDVSGLLLTSGDWDSGWAFNNFGLSGWSDNWNGTLPEYESASDLLSGDVVAQCLDGTGDGSAYMITRTPSTLDYTFQYNLFENPDIATDPTDWTLSHSWNPLAWPEEDNNYNSAVNIVSNATQTMVVSVEKSDVYYQYRPAAGAWSAWGKIGAGSPILTYFGQTRNAPPIVLDGSATWSVGHATTGIRGFIVMKQSSLGGAWSPVTNPSIPNGTGNIPRTIVREGTDIFVSFPTANDTVGNLYRIDDGTATWTDITPTGGYWPRRANAVATNGTNVWAICTNEDGQQKLFTSINSGDDWTDRGVTGYDWLIRLSSDSVFLLGGNNALDVTINDFGTFHSRLGAWGDIGSIGLMENFTSMGLL